MRLLSVIGLLTLCGVAASALPQGKQRASGIPHDFKGIRLGMTVSEFKATPVPDSKEYDGNCSDRSTCGKARPRPECSSLGEPYATTISCSWIYGAASGIHSSTHYPEVAGHMAGDYSLLFIAKPGDAEPRLYKISFEPRSTAYPKVVAALQDRFGKPTRVRTHRVQNQFGAVYTNDALEWSNGTSVIYVARFADNVDQMKLEYVLTDYESYARRAKAAPSPRL